MDRYDALDRIIDTLEGGGNFGMGRKDENGDWIAASEFGREAPDSPMAGGAAYGAGDTADEALVQLAKDLNNPRNPTERRNAVYALGSAAALVLVALRGDRDDLITAAVDTLFGDLMEAMRHDSAVRGGVHDHPDADEHGVGSLGADLFNDLAARQEAQEADEVSVEDDDDGEASPA